MSTRLDLAYSASEMGRVMSNPSEKHCNMLKRMCQYLKNTSHLGLRYGGAAVRRNRNARNKISVQLMHDHVPMGMADVSFGCDPADRRSMTSWVILLNRAPIAYRAKRQPFAVTRLARARYSVSARLCVRWRPRHVRWPTLEY